MRAFKFLGLGSVGLFSGYAWPRPVNGGPGAWVEAGGPLEPCRVGVHAVRGASLLDWMDDELWRVEIAGEVVDDAGVLVAERGRLLSRIGGWDAEAARALTAACIARLRDGAVTGLRRAGDAATADRLVTANAPEARRLALEAEARGDATVAMTCVTLADALSLAAGSRPELDVIAHPGVAPPASAVTANVAYVAAHTLAAAHGPAGHAAAFADERAWQLEWLAERVGAHGPAGVGDGTAAFA